MIGLAQKDGGIGFYASPSPKTANSVVGQLSQVEPEFFPIANTARVKVDSIKYVGKSPETDQKVFSAEIAGESYKKTRWQRSKENIGGVRLDLRTTLRGIPDGRVYNKNSLKFFDEEASTAGLSKFSGLDEAITNTRHGKEHVLSVEDTANKLIQKDKRYKNADPAVVKVAARLHDTLRTLDYDSIVRGSHGTTLARVMENNKLKTSEEYLKTLNPADADSLRRAWADNSGIKIWDETISEYRGMTPKQQSKVRKAIGMHTAAKSNLRSSILLSPEEKIIADADRIDLVRFNRGKANWMPKQRKMFTSPKIQREILAEKYGVMYTEPLSKTKVKSKDKSRKQSRSVIGSAVTIPQLSFGHSTAANTARNAADGAMNYLEGMLTPSRVWERRNPREYNPYRKIKSSYKNTANAVFNPTNIAKSSVYAASQGVAVSAIAEPSI